MKTNIYYFLFFIFLRNIKSFRIFDLIYIHVHVFTCKCNQYLGYMYNTCTHTNEKYCKQYFLSTTYLEIAFRNTQLTL